MSLVVQALEFAAQLAPVALALGAARRAMCTGEPEPAGANKRIARGDAGQSHFHGVSFSRRTGCSKQVANRMRKARGIAAPGRVDGRLGAHERASDAPQLWAQLQRDRGERGRDHVLR